MSEKITIIDVAKDAKVGVSTVSRVLNNHVNVKKTTRESVLRSMKDLGYEPNIAARSLVQQNEISMENTKEVAIILGHVALGQEVSISDSYFSGVIKGVEEVVRTTKYNLSFSTLKEDILEKFEMNERFVKRGVKGVIIIGDVEENILSSLRDILEAVVLVDGTTTLSRVDVVTCDNEEGAFDATSHLINLGHKRIGLIRGVVGHYFDLAIYNGYCRALARYEIPYDEKLIAEGNFHPDGGYKAMKELLDRECNLTALFSNDEMAIGAMKAMKEKGLKIPEEIAVVGFDNIDLSSHVHPSLTTVVVPKKNLGRLAGKKLFECLEDPANHQYTKTVIPLELVIRDSCGANFKEVKED